MRERSKHLLGRHTRNVSSHFSPGRHGGSQVTPTSSTVTHKGWRRSAEGQLLLRRRSQSSTHGRANQTFLREFVSLGTRHQDPVLFVRHPHVTFTINTMHYTGESCSLWRFETNQQASGHVWLWRLQNLCCNLETGSRNLITISEHRSKHFLDICCFLGH